ncbi:class I SAM-dependent methyltransferase [Hymenobacter sp. BT491]|uniref:class I SAM-dependent methyltransferase n=1 Tax=Hymenobacter sp. BT491 TaxID=2766779 RepID=UPI001653C6A6|nr:class I SAM-dependent methyltransferase [Hymenobacter sp. BT491]MBC6988473.1 class I SAM-dependent methyltransferase [Hymenobacter sp. BT491]
MPLPDAGFDRVATFYDPLARLVFGRALQQAQRAALAGLPPGSPNVLIIGGGSGWVLTEVLRRRPTARVVYLEAAPAMLDKSRRLMQQTLPGLLGQVKFRLGTENALLPTEQFDALITFFLLDLFEPIRTRSLVHRLYEARNPSAPWLLADFYPPRWWWQRLLLSTMYQFFRLTTGISGRQLPPFREEMARLGLHIQKQQFFYGGLVEAAVLNEGPAT